MKKFITTLTIIVSLMTSAFASEENVKAEILSAFKSRFNNAQEVTCSSGKMYTEATFLYYGVWLTAHYNHKAELTGVSRNITSDQLPHFLQNKIKKNYAGYWITELFVLTNNEGYSYYLTLRNADQEVILESLNGKSWTIYQSTIL